MDAQIVVNSPALSDGTRVRGPHLDRPDKLISALLYLRSEDDDFDRRRPRNVRAAAGRAGLRSAERPFSRFRAARPHLSLSPQPARLFSLQHPAQHHGGASPRQPNAQAALYHIHYSRRNWPHRPKHVRQPPRPPPARRRRAPQARCGQSAYGRRAIACCRLSLGGYFGRSHEHYGRQARRSQQRERCPRLELQPHLPRRAGRTSASSTSGMSSARTRACSAACMPFALR